MNREDVLYIHTQNGILLNYKKEWNLAISDNIDRPRGYYAKWNKPDKDIYYMKQNKWTKQNKTYRSRGQIVGCQRGGRLGNG